LYREYAAPPLFIPVDRNETGFHIDTMWPRILSHWLFSLPAVALVLALSVADAGAAKKQRAHDKFYEHALELIAQGDHQGGIIELKNALQADPKDIAARVLLGNTYLELEDGTSAAKAFLRARKDGARDSFILVPLARAYVLQGQFNKALDELRTAGQHHSAAVEITLIRGDAYLALLSFRKAEASYLEASKLRPKDARPLVGLARVKLANDDIAGAKNYVKWALEANPKDPRAWFIQGEVADLQRDPVEALKSYDRAIELAPKFPGALLARAAIKIDQGRHNEAEPDILVVRKANTRNPRAAYLLSLVRAKQGRLSEARKLLVEAENILKSYPGPFMLSHPPSLLLGGVVTFFRDDFYSSYRLLSLFLKRSPHHAGARKLLASIALKWKEPKSAIQYLDPLGPASSSDIDVLIMYGDALSRLKRYREASAVLKRAENLVEPGSTALFKLVVVRLQSGQDPEAVKILKSEIGRDPDAVHAAIFLGAAQMKRGEYRTALATLNAVTERQPDNAVAHNLAGGAHLELGDIAAARKSYRAAIAADSNQLHAVENLAKVEARLGNYDDASELFTSILDRDARNGRVMISLAEIAHRRKDGDEAIRWLEKARTSSRNPRDATIRLINLYIDLSRAEKALFLARELHNQQPGDFDSIVLLGRAEFAAKKMKAANATFGNLAELAEERKSAARLHQAAVWLVRVRDKKRAWDSLLKALDVDAKHIPSHMLLFTLEMASGNLDAASVRARKVKALDGALHMGHMLEGDVLMRRRQYGAAIRAYDQALGQKELSEIADRAFHARRVAGQNSFDFAQAWASKRPGDPFSQQMLATAYADVGRVKEALALYEQLLEQSPESVPLLNNIALLYQKAGDGRAIELARRAYEAEPSSVTMDTYGWILVLAGRVDDGLAMLRNAKLRAPNVPEIRYHLAVALNAKGQTEAAKKELRAALQTGHAFDGRVDAEALSAKLSAAGR
jgi:putative PEP-CTERM system TPR-repeat lipoprotein